MTYLIYVLAFFLAVHNPVTPSLFVLTRAIPCNVKLQAVRCFLAAGFRNALTIPADILAPVIVPLALLFTRWEDNELPSLFSWWDNDASINGDVRTDDASDGLGGWALKIVPIADTSEARAMCYWAPGHHPRSFYARWVWLGLRNRASALSVQLGHTYTGEALERYGDDVVRNNVPGWYLLKAGKAFRLFHVVKLGPVILRIHYGYKLSNPDYRKRVNLVAIAFSLQRWREPIMP